MRKFTIFLSLLMFIGLQVVNAQNRTITGKVTSAEDGSAIPGVTVSVKGTTTGTLSDIDGKYSLAVPASAKTLTFSFIGMKIQEVEIGGKTIINVSLESSTTAIEGVVVTALGITREKKSLGYSTQEVKGDIVNTVRGNNFVNSLSGKVSGVQIKKNTNMGGSTNILLRGSKSLTGDNQALFVIDGVPVSNDVTNTSSQKQAGLGYDYGNAASDINPDDIESINILKGAAASALYGARAANGVIMITTKKGAKAKTTIPGRSHIGVTVNSGFNIGFVDKSTFPEYQDQYGGGYGRYYEGPDSYWFIRDVNGDGTDEQWVVTSEDASYGAPFDPSLNVYQWNAVDPASPNYMKATPWKAAENGPISFFENPTTYTNSIAIDNTMQNGSYRFSYTKYKQNGLLPNSKLQKDNLLFNTNWKITDRLTGTGSANFIRSSANGRNSTGYSDNIMTSFRQWWQTNVDVQEQKDMYDLTKRNVTWNYADPTAPYPIFWDNAYWTRYQNYQSDSRNRFIGNMSLNYKVTDWLDIFGRVAGDTYSELQEERRAVGSIAAPFGIGSGSAADGSLGRSESGSGYLRRDITYSEYNYDLMLNFNKDLTKDLNLRGVFGMNESRRNYNRLISATNGGLAIANVYSLQNTVDPLVAPKELASKIGVRGTYANASLGYQSTYYIDLSIRRDYASTLKDGESKYTYPAIAGSMIFSNLLKDLKWLSFGKLRLNYAEVGHEAGFDQLYNSYEVKTSFNSLITSVPGTNKNPDLKPERTKSVEAGLEMFFFGRRLGFDVAYYKTRSIDQILPITVSRATGYSSTYINAGEIENKGIELSIMATPVKLKDFKWDITINWSKNTNKVVELIEGVDNLPLGSFQGGVTINAMVGQPYGTIYGTDYQYLNGEKLINKTNGRYLITPTSNNIIGNANPDWNGGIANSLSYKNWSLSFLIDMQQGGDIFSLDMYYGLATGLYKETAYTNDLGNPVRNLITGTLGSYGPTSGGFINQGVNPDGTPNQTRVAASNYGTFGYLRNPNSAFVYDASYVKLREIAISYNLPAKLLEKTFLAGASFSVVGSNVWIISKNLPYADPESGLGAGNLQGYSVGSLPTTRDFGFNIKLNF
jgi:TonB-linked SusC/RagA family outer membrane protein